MVNIQLEGEERIVELAQYKLKLLHLAEEEEDSGGEEIKVKKPLKLEKVGKRNNVLGQNYCGVRLILEFARQKLGRDIKKSQQRSAIEIDFLKKKSVPVARIFE